MPVEIVVLVTQPFAENTYFVRRSGRSDCVVIDPGFGPQRIVQHIRNAGWHPAAILLTHGHVDHIAGVAGVKAAWPELPILIGENDAPMLTDAAANLSGLGGVRVVSPPATRLLKEGDTVSMAGLNFDVLDIPGHSPGHIVYILRGETPLRVLGGDVLFQGSIGRTDFPGGDSALLIGGIREKLFSLPDETLVYPGHGDPTTVGEERRSNPFCGQLS